MNSWRNHLMNHSFLLDGDSFDLVILKDTSSIYVISLTPEVGPTGVSLLECGRGNKSKTLFSCLIFSNIKGSELNSSEKSSVFLSLS